MTRGAQRGGAMRDGATRHAPREDSALRARSAAWSNFVALPERTEKIAARPPFGLLWLNRDSFDLD